MYLSFIVISFSLLYPTLSFPHYDIRTRRAVFDIIPEGFTGADCKCGNSDPFCVQNKICECENKNNLETIKESKNRRSKLRTLFKKWILNRGKKDKICAIWRVLTRRLEFGFKTTTVLDQQEVKFFFRSSP